MNIIIVSEESFYRGTGQENRQLSYAKGMTELFHSVAIWTLLPNDQRISKRTLDGIEIVYLKSGQIRNKCTTALTGSIKFYLGFFHLLYQENRKNKIDCIMAQSFTTTAVFFLFFATRILKIKLIRDQSEFPFVHRPGSGWFRIFLYNHLFFKVFDGLLVINNVLMDYFQNRIRKKAKLMKFPMIVDPKRFEISVSMIKDEYIAYCGDMRNNKDGIPILVEAFKLVSDKYTGIKLYLIGETRGIAEVEEFKRQALYLGISEKIVFTGKVSRDDMPQYLCNATVLVLSRPRNKQAEGGFPTKLGEYLSTGRPTVVTKVGEIEDYLTDEVNAFLAVPDSAEAFASRIMYVLSNRDLAEKVGLNGKRLAYTTFNYKIQAENLADFIRNLSKDV
jgi:glycosyltransferase involved in cell wall biosynthesis